MPRKPGKKPPKAPPKAQGAKADPSDTLIDAMLRLAAARGWSGLSMGDIAASADLPLRDCQTLFPDKIALLAAYLARLDRQMRQRLAAQGALDPDRSSARELLFDAIMTRFEVMAPDRAALARIRADLRCDPIALVGLLPAVRRSLESILQAAGLESMGLGGLGGLRGLVRRHGLALVLARVTPVWLADDSQDMGRTMAALDRSLLRIEQWLRWLAPA